MAAYVSDTHALWWYLGGSPLLSPPARLAFDEAANGTGQIIIPAIVIAEWIMLVEKRRATVNLAQMMAALSERPGFQFVALTPEIALRIQQLTSLRDIHDRLIVAEALTRNLPLITRDAAITASGLVATLW